ncbi:hypothetical protein LMH87_001919 [Akanthomyces muscarius]|uniref:Uncharacterized protein n=1 Tax=Akanthomyces muscarius TaxID=2231603 RepID=A0A9W8UJ60_AKAMU|nr:hypothetical protein LMH87_001919 [Akanthomyces muscarius]KAJ4147398.1 hypothetical protein LMH87_001919 [Akanthomyces muscarius]
MPAFCLAGPQLAITALIYSWSAQNAAGDTKRQTPTALHLKKRNAARGSVDRNNKDLGLVTYFQEYNIRLESASPEAVLR